jgi:hypothetical protein
VLNNLIGIVRITVLVKPHLEASQPEGLNSCTQLLDNASTAPNANATAL